MSARLMLGRWVKRKRCEIQVEVQGLLQVADAAFTPACPQAGYGSPRSSRRRFPTFPTYSWIVYDYTGIFPTIEYSIIITESFLQTTENESLVPPWCSWRRRHLHKVVNLKDLSFGVSRIIPEEKGLLNNWAFLRGSHKPQDFSSMGFCCLNKVRPAKLAHNRQTAREWCKPRRRREKFNKMPSFSTGCLQIQPLLQFCERKMLKSPPVFLFIVDWWMH